MPPKKKTMKAKSAELKKKNTEIAKNIISKLMDQNDVQDVVSDLKTTPDLNSSASISKSKDFTEIDKSNGAATVHLADSGSRTGVAKQVKIQPIKVKDADPDKAKKANATAKVASDFVRPSQTNNNVNSSSKSKGRTSNDNSVGGIWSTAKPFFYEIDCQRVSDSIDVNDLQRYLKDQLKVNGEKNNLGDVTICCQGQKVVINSKVFLPKRSLRFLSKKFLKKAWNIQVVTKTKNSYAFKYVGTS